MTKELSNGKIIETKVISGKPLLSTDLSLKSGSYHRVTII